MSDFKISDKVKFARCADHGECTTCKDCVANAYVLVDKLGYVHGTIVDVEGTRHLITVRSNPPERIDDNFDSSCSVRVSNKYIIKYIELYDIAPEDINVVSFI